MKSFLLSLIVIFGLACTPKVSMGVESVSLEPSHSSKDGYLSKVEVDYIKSRTVQVKRDCSPTINLDLGEDINPETIFDGRGSGAILRSYDSVSYVVTAQHVINNKFPSMFTCSIYVQREGQSEKVPAKIVFQNETHDAAIVAVNQNFKVDTKIEEDVYPGLPVWAAGYPSLHNQSKPFLSVTSGDLATLNVPYKNDPGSFHRITAQVYFGSSGGGIWTEKGTLIGITNFLYAQDNLPYEGAYYIKPMVQVKKLVENLGVLSRLFVLEGSKALYFMYIF